jgi:hypothetical protein
LPEVSRPQRITKLDRFNASTAGGVYKASDGALCLVSHKHVLMLKNHHGVKHEKEDSKW